MFRWCKVTRFLLSFFRFHIQDRQKNFKLYYFARFYLQNHGKTHWYNIIIGRINVPVVSQQFEIAVKYTWLKFCVHSKLNVEIASKCTSLTFCVHPNMSFNVKIADFRRASMTPASTLYTYDFKDNLYHLWIFHIHFLYKFTQKISIIQNLHD
jgi:hypothetical protein